MHLTMSINLKYTSYVITYNKKKKTKKNSISHRSTYHQTVSRVFPESTFTIKRQGTKAEGLVIRRRLFFSDDRKFTEACRHSQIRTVSEQNPTRVSCRGAKTKATDIHPRLFPSWNVGFVTIIFIQRTRTLPFIADTKYVNYTMTLK